MKVRQQVATALAIVSVSAQNTPPAYQSSEPISYVTMTVDDCPTAAIETMITVTNGVTVTYCPECDKTSPVPGPTTTPKPPKHTTVYTTTYMSLCPTGTVPATYTVTEECDDDEPTWTPGPSHVPQGYTVTVKQCTAGCDKDDKPVPVTITEPCDCEATQGTSLGPKPTKPADNDAPKPSGTPIGQIPDGQVQNPGPKPSDNAGTPPPAATCPGGEHCPGGNVPSAPGATTSANPPYPTAATTVKCPGPECAGTGVLTHPIESSPVPTKEGETPAPPSDTGVTPPVYDGGAAAMIGSASVAIVVALLAVAL